MSSHLQSIDIGRESMSKQQIEEIIRKGTTQRIPEKRVAFEINKDEYSGTKQPWGNQSKKQRVAERQPLGGQSKQQRVAGQPRGGQSKNQPLGVSGVKQPWGQQSKKKNTGEKHSHDHEKDIILSKPSSQVMVEEQDPGLTPYQEDIEMLGLSTEDERISVMLKNLGKGAPIDPPPNRVNFFEDLIDEDIGRREGMVSRPLPFCCEKVSTTKKGAPTGSDTMLMHFTVQTKKHTKFLPYSLHQASALSKINQGNENVQVVRVSRLIQDGEYISHEARYFKYLNQIKDTTFAAEYCDEMEENCQLERPDVLWDCFDRVEGAFRELKCPVHLQTYVCEIWNGKKLSKD